MSHTSTSTPKSAHPMADGQAFVGSWSLIIFETEGPPTRGLATLGADRTVVTAEHPVVTPPTAPGVVFTSSGHGAWAPTGPDTAIVTFVGLGGDERGDLFAVATARCTVTLGADGQTFSGAFVWDVADPAGRLLASFPGTLQATRIVAEAPASADDGHADHAGLAPGPRR